MSHTEFIVGEDPATDLNPNTNGLVEYNENMIVIWVGDNEVLENVVLDVTEVDDADISIRTDNEHSFPIEGASGWTLRNIGIRGKPTRNNQYIFNVGADLGGEGHIENVFVDTRPDDLDENGYGGGAMWSIPGHEGTITLNNIFIAGNGDNANYFEQDRSIGTYIWENCYYRDNQPTNFRTGLRPSVIRDCIAVLNDPHGVRGVYTTGGHTEVANSRAYWNRGGHEKPEADPPLLDNFQLFWMPDDHSPVRPIQTNISNGDNSVTDVERVTINQEWVDHAVDGNLQDSGMTGEGDAVNAVFREGAGSQINVSVGDVDIQEPNIFTLGEGVPYTPVMAAEGERGYPLDPFGPAPTGGVEGEVPVEPSVDVDTKGTGNITPEAATVVGEVTELVALDFVYVYFLWGEVGSGLPNATAADQVSNEEDYSQLIEDLDPETEYEFRAVAEIPEE